MKSDIIELYTAETLPLNRCYDGILLLWPADNVAEIQHFTETYTLSNQLHIINHNDIFQIKKNEKTIILYIASDWFKESGFRFYNYMFNIQLIQSVNDIKKCMASLMVRYLEETLTEEALSRQIRKICTILVEEASVNKNFITSQMPPAIPNQYREIVEYIHEHIDSKLTLDSMSKAFFTSKTALSAKFYEIFNVGFKKYVETLRIGLSLEYLNTTDDTIGYIAERVGFSHSSLYTKKFKQHLLMTPNVYRKLTQFQKNISYLFKDFRVSLSEKGKTAYIAYLVEALRNFNDDEENMVYIDEINPRFSPTRPFVMAIQIHEVSELKMMLIDCHNKSIIDFDNEAMLLIQISISQIYRKLDIEEIFQMLDTIYQYNLNVAFMVEDQHDIEYMKEGLMKSERFLAHPICTALKSHSTQISLTFNLKDTELKEIYVQMLRIQDLDFNIDFNLDITQLFNQPEEFKAMETRLKRISFTHYFIDNAELDYPYLEKEYDNLPIKQVAELTEIKSVMKRMHLDERQYILINLPNRNLLNDDLSLLDSTPLMMYMFTQFYGALYGIGINLVQQTQSKTLYLYDKNGLKTTLYFLYQQLSDFETFYFYNEKPYVITEDKERFAIMLYDWRVIENEMYLTNQNRYQFNIGFKSNQLRKNYLVTREITDYKYGNMNTIISPPLLDTYHWSEYLKRKIKSVNHPRFDVFEHDFRVGTMNTNINFNSLQLLSFYKKKR
ncbi:helix-turn-helix transcriptional regulator [Staphylococcus debuckii]|uniref:helix-turn-helix transcriptional regulator n=1 Tax=Staphylococcus debuckii TaxID=2044912 RepID=UPI000F436FF3|nr:AraC family transcriptional regulator [Staphylococcus debuckii]AYU56197.1 AraC family transcriptional regulator [Staphylococcus debuckii]